MAFKEETVTWSAGFMSNAIPLADYKIITVIFPATMSGNGETADLQMQDNAGNWYDIYDSTGTKLTIVITQGAAVGIDANLLETVAASFIRIDNTGGTTEAADRTIKVKLKR